MKKSVYTVSLFGALLAMIWASPCLAAAPQITNIQVQQQGGSNLVFITYDLFDPDGDNLFVSARVSPLGNDVWNILCSSATGDIGFIASAGTGKTIAWDAYADYPDFLGDNCQVRLMVTDTNPYPILDFFKITPDTIPLSHDIPDTVGFGRPMHLFWSGHAPMTDGLPAQVFTEMDTLYPYDDGLSGTKWWFMNEECIPEFEDCWQPRLYNEATGDSVSYFGYRQQFYFANNGSGSSYFQQLLPDGPFDMRFNTLDIAGNEMQESQQGFSFIVNYDPETLILNGQTDWDHPEDPEIYPYYIMLDDVTQTHYPFQDGDRIPDRTYVVFKALYKDDGRDMVLDPGYTMALTGFATGTINLASGGQFSFHTNDSPLDTEPAWSTGFSGFYADTLGFMPSPNTEFTFAMAAVDEHGRHDGTPAILDFTVGYPPCVQCLELLPDSDIPSAFTDDVACYDPDMGTHPCFGDTSVFYIKNATTPEIPGRTYMQPQSLTFLGIHKLSGDVEFSDDELSADDYYIFPSTVYRMSFLLHGKDDVRDAWTDPLMRAMAWRYQVDYDCDPGNTIADGGGIDDMQQVTWGRTGLNDNSLEIQPTDGVWRVLVDVVIPDDLVTLGPDIFHLIISFGMGEGDPDLTDELFDKCVRQLSRGMVQAVALDQTMCSVLPLRPAKYHIFDEVRPPASGPGMGTWRDCFPSFTGVDQSFDLSAMAMESLDSEPVARQFQLIFQGTEGDFSCATD